tara:strand:+ start:16777 stop:17733 length:957 start_codon:yes stop_codon:yes gene_type:complete
LSQFSFCFLDHITRVQSDECLIIQKTMKLAYLTAHAVLNPDDKHCVEHNEHWRQVQSLTQPLKERGIWLESVVWNRPDIDWNDYGAAVIGTTWDYHNQSEIFLAQIETIERSGVPVFNSPSLVRWNLRKTYLRTLAEHGIPVIPTVWLDGPVVADDIRAAFETLSADRLVIKRQIGAGAAGQIVYHREDDISDFPHAAMIQPFIRAIREEGEFSFIFIGGTFSHAVLKRPKSGDYRIQATFGGVDMPITPTTRDLQSAERVLSALNEVPLYARIDMVRLESGNLSLMELELIEPFLYPGKTGRLGVLFAEALLKQLNC